MATTTPTTITVLGPTIGLRSLMATMRRKRRIWLITGLVGLIVGASLHFVIPPKYTAQTDLYLTMPAGSNPALGDGEQRLPPRDGGGGRRRRLQTVIST